MVFQVIFLVGSGESLMPCICCRGRAIIVFQAYRIGQRRNGHFNISEKLGLGGRLNWPMLETR